MPRFRRPTPNPTPSEPSTGAGIGADCEAFLAGRYAEHLIALGRRVPAWAWLNQAAHADADTIVATAGRVPDGSPLLWTEARAAVAAVVAAALAWGADLHELQQEVLIPLELTLIHQPLTPDALARRVYQALA